MLIPRLVVDGTMNSYVEDSVSKYHPKAEIGFDPDRSLELRVRTPGLLDSLYWDDSPMHSARLDADQVRVELRHVALNFQDVMTAMGQLDGCSSLLIEGSGVVSQVGEAAKKQFSVGDAVCVVGPDGLALTSNINYQHAFPVLAGVDMRVAAALPVAYATALYSLSNVANLQPGDSIRIHSAAGAVGQAMIAVARHLGAECIFVTVGNDKKRALIREKFNIPDQNIFSSRDSKFGQQVLASTNQQGVDIVVNSLSGDLVRQGCSVLAPFGRFVEIGKKDIYNNARLETKYLSGNRVFAVVDLIELQKQKPRVFANVMVHALELINNNSRLPILDPISSAPISEIEASFRTMQAGKHTGKLVMDVHPDLPLTVSFLIFFFFFLSPFWPFRVPTYPHRYNHLVRNQQWWASMVHTSWSVELADSVE